MAWSTAFRNAVLDRTLAAASVTNKLTLKAHTGAPGPAGTSNEVVGGGYAAQTVTFGSSASGAKLSTQDAAFSVPASTTVAYVSLWDGAIFVDSYDSPDEAFTLAGTYTLPAGSVTVSLV